MDVKIVGVKPEHMEWALRNAMKWEGLQEGRHHGVGVWSSETRCSLFIYKTKTLTCAYGDYRE